LNVSSHVSSVPVFCGTEINDAACAMFLILLGNAVALRNHLRHKSEETFAGVSDAAGIGAELRQPLAGLSAGCSSHSL
jgi:hypothetical protein